MPALLLLDAGGTISSARTASGALGAGQGLALPGPFADLPVRQAYRGLSEQMTLADAQAVVQAAVDAARESDVAGVVVAHGTDTLEETAFLADLVWNTPKPLVFTGAQRAPGAADFDGLDNLSLALALAGDGRAQGSGVWIAFGGRILPAAGGFKRHTAELAGFDHRQGLAGDLARLSGPPPSRPAPLTTLRLDETVETLAVGLGSSTRLLDAAVASGARGLVLQALGRGNVSDALVSAAAQAAGAGCVLMATSRCPYGEAAPDYESGRALWEAGVVFAGALGPPQARILLSALLGQNDDAAQVRQAARDWIAARG
ncbi:asparaginase [Phenylobacterium sp.]|uniref:asparaginase n=1 Tax=Phenylobacterium sp. TaxID=1871053 RepID=UPI002FD9546C